MTELPAFPEGRLCEGFAQSNPVKLAYNLLAMLDSSFWIASLTARYYGE